MEGPSFSIRRLAGAEAALFRAIRLEGLELDPSAFGATLAEETTRPLEWVAARLEEGSVFGAFRGESLDGVAGFRPLEGARARHKGVLWGMYVRPRARGAGMGRALLETVLVHAAERVEQVLLSVARSNRPARQLYERSGFVEYGIEPRALRSGEAYEDEILMVRFLTAADGR